ncbi:MBL fold metallo-hydrolase [Palleronia caenipelagi]|uniref:MBL fold metallo-hydrolase n=1 Tax=Palleronia caenipelagi TaxID=2489174 RepID=A0A547Q901_9RHOB|nr:MBL fold metallo-hydrolase [Palleronia caenipelagi]TRD22834.1 MBL fold metallo-hydrolase [Palleronia caenipelagi]
MTLRFTILGCGSSGGVPRIGGDWGQCDPTDPHNRRRRCSLLVERMGDAGTTRVLIDASPDLREQLLSAEVGELDGVVFTHAHADHCHGLDDLRMIVIAMRQRLNIWADEPTMAALKHRFDYAFETPPNSDYPPILDAHLIDGDVTIDGAGGAIILTPFRVEHGRIDALGFRIGGLAYLPDVSAMTDDAWAAVKDLDVWIVDALRRAPHPSHAHLERTLEWIAQATPKSAILTNMHTDLDYATIDAETPDHVRPAHDLMRVTLPSS